MCVPLSDSKRVPDVSFAVADAGVLEPLSPNRGFKIRKWNREAAAAAASVLCPARKIPLAAAATAKLSESCCKQARQDGTTGVQASD